MGQEPANFAKFDIESVRAHVDAIDYELKKIGYRVIPERERPAYRLKDLALMLGVSYDTVRSMVYSGHIPPPDRHVGVVPTWDYETAMIIRGMRKIG
jgi:hypothetical protein